MRRTGYAKIGGLSIAYQAHGDGAPLIFQPGYMTNIDQNWEWPAYARFLERIGSFAQLILVDRRGTGLSDRTPPDASFEDTRSAGSPSTSRRGSWPSPDPARCWSRAR